MATKGLPYQLTFDKTLIKKIKTEVSDSLTV
jgi:hypothetical protein